MRHTYFIMKGGFSTTSCPTLMIKSAFSIHTCTKSFADSAQHPKYKGCSSTKNSGSPIQVNLNINWTNFQPHPQRGDLEE